MQTVRVWDALRYASKFVGLVLAVVIVAGGFLAGGAYLAADAISFTDPSFSALSETPVFIGIVLMTVGVILGAIGWIALAYKFLADGVATAMAVRGVGDGTVASAATDAETENGDETTESPSSADTASPDEGSSPVDERGGASGAGQAGMTGTAASGGHAMAEADQREETRSTSHSASDTETAPTENAGGRDSTADADVDRMEPGDVDERTAVDDESSQVSEPEDPPEWTPPDPSEFETGGSADSGGTESDGQWTDETRDADQGTRGEAAMQGDETVVDDVNPAEPSPDPDEIDEDATLADEGVESFTTASDEDPLSDRLPGSDDN